MRNRCVDSYLLFENEPISQTKGKTLSFLATESRGHT